MGLKLFVELLHLLAEPKLDQAMAALPLIRWATLDPKAALSFALNRDELRTAERIIAAIVHEMAKTDLPAANAALGQLEAEERRSAQRAIVRLLQPNDPVAALAYARELGDIGAESDVLSSWARSDPLTAAAEMGTGKPGQEPAIPTIAMGLAKKDRSAFEQGAAKWAEPAARAATRATALEIDMLTDRGNRGLVGRNTTGGRGLGRLLSRQ